MNLVLSINQVTAKLPDSDWLRFGIILLCLLAILQTVRMVSRLNRYLLLFIFIVGGAWLMTSWVHNRNEPSFLTPVVDIVQPWFPKRVRSFDV